MFLPGPLNAPGLLADHYTVTLRLSRVCGKARTGANAHRPDDTKRHFFNDMVYHLQFITGTRRPLALE